MVLLKSLLALAAACLPVVSSRHVFAHVVVGNTAAHTVDTWKTDINLAAEAGIDAFALNIAYPDSNIPTQVANAFQAAEELHTSNGTGFTLFFSFDYLGGGSPWNAVGDESVESYMNKYKSSSAYFLYNGLPFVSTFEGTGNMQDWAAGGEIRSAVGDVYFVPDWTSLGASGIGAALPDIEGHFSWDMWPTGANDMTTANDLAWQSAVSPKTYMMGVSPWFFHSTEGSQDWVWRGDDLWADRWQQVMEVKPDFVEIVTWNDFGEAHYIGPVHAEEEIAAGSHIYVADMPHDSWRDLLPYYISQYKGTNHTISEDKMQYWYRTSPVSGGLLGTVTGNVANLGQETVSPDQIMQDKVFFSALLKQDATVTVQIGDNEAVSYQGTKGINHWSQPFDGQTGAVEFTVLRQGQVVKSGTGAEITATTTLSNGLTNFNTWVGGC
ncbi:Glucan endo-1,3-alpha-glucosidase agn1 [Phlyctema vagabunda]|uniref:Glucan endo-1,3-alpha-glucosidase agn1 n=1 Tax=Phlyctema vagabunda TaxID=108571 RepID=A0ABR4PHH6_9HELO